VKFALRASELNGRFAKQIYLNSSFFIIPYSFFICGNAARRPADKKGAASFDATPLPFRFA